jgi:hypothetical protein
MDFKELYEMWLDQCGGLDSAVKTSYDSYKGIRKAKNSVTTQMVDKPFLKQGSLYLFNYVDLKLIDEVKGGGDAPFFDTQPYIFALEHDKQYQYGVNLNALPMQSRIQLWSMLYRLFWNDITYNMDKKYVRWREIKRVTTENIGMLIKMKSKIAINKYDVTMIRNTKVIEWESNVPASTLYMKHNMLFNQAKKMNVNTLWKAV